jgi:hypothetical protein
MLKPEIKEKLITALLSGNYKQGKHTLRNANEEFCCLGVLCDVIKDDINGQWNLEKSITSLLNRNQFVVGDASRENYPPWPVIEFCSESKKDEDFRSLDSAFGQLADKNDRGQTFEEIAEYIKEKL